MTTTDTDDSVTYSTMRLVELTGATYRQLDWWCRCGYLPDMADGSGSRREFTTAELDLIYTVLGLLRFGITPSRAFDIARRLLADEPVTARIADIFEITISVARHDVISSAQPTTGGTA